MRLIQNYIDGQFVSSERLFDVVNPATHEVIAREPLADADLVRAACESAEKALPEWQLMNRARYLNQIANLLEANKRDLAQAEAMDTGKPMSLSLLADIPLAIEAFRQAAQETDLENSRFVSVLSSLGLSSSLPFTASSPTSRAGVYCYRLSIPPDTHDSSSPE